MDVSARPPDCDGQAADAVSAYTMVKMEDTPKIAQKSKVRMSRYMDTSSTTQVAQIVVEHWRSSGSFGTKFIRTSTCWSLVGKTVRGSFNGTWMAKSAALGTSVRSSKTRIVLIGIRGWDQNWLERSSIWFPCGRNWWKMLLLTSQLHSLIKKLMKLVDLGEPPSFLDHVYLGCTQRECKPNEIIIEEYTRMFEWRISAGATEKLPGWAKASRKNSSVVLRHGRTNSKKRCERYCELPNKKRGAVLQSFKSLRGWPSIQTGRTWISWRIITSLLTHCIEVLVLGTNWKTRHSVVGQQTCKNSHNMCLLNPCNVFAQLVTSQSVAVDTTMTFFSRSDVLGPSRITRKQLASSIAHSWSNWKITWVVKKLTRKDGRVVLRHGRTCAKMRCERLRAGKQKSGAAPRSFKSLFGCSPSQKGKSLNQLEYCHKYAHKLLWNACTWHGLVDWKFSGQCTSLDRSLWPTFSSFDFIFSSHKWISTLLPFGQHCKKLEWERVPDWESLFDHKKQRFFSAVHVDDTKIGWKEAEFESHVEEIDETRWSWRTNLITYLWDALNVNANRMKLLLKKMNEDNGNTYARWNWKIIKRETVTQKQWRGPTHGRTNSKIRWAVLRAGKQTRHSNFFTLSSLCLDDNQFKQEELESVGELSQVCSHIVSNFGLDTNWETPHSVVCQQNCKDSHLPLWESYVSSEAEHLSPSFGCARSKRQHPTVLQNLESFLWMLDCAWMDFLLSTFGTSWWKCYVRQTALQDMVN